MIFTPIGANGLQLAEDGKSVDSNDNVIIYELNKIRKIKSESANPEEAIAKPTQKMMLLNCSEMVSHIKNDHLPLQRIFRCPL